jgi:hypothetical protein
MLLKFFKGTGPGVIFLIIITFGLLWISPFLHPPASGLYIFETRPMPFYNITELLIGSNPVIGVIFSLMILSFLLFLLVNFNTSVFFINERTFMPAVIYVLFSALFPTQQLLNPVIPATLFLMLALRRIMDSYRKPGIAFNFFDAAILISLGSLFYANLIWFGLLIFIGIALLRTGNIIEILSSIIGLVTPYVLIFGIYYVLGRDLGVLLEDIRINLFGDSPEYMFPRLTIIVLIYSGLMLLISTVYLMQQVHSKKIKSRKTFYLLLWALVISLAVFFVMPSTSMEVVWIIAVPVSYVLAHYFVFAKGKIIPGLVFTGFFLIIFLVQALNIF